MTDFDRDVAVISGSKAVRAILDRLCTQTGMGFAAVARVTEHRWIACQVVDRIGFGMEPGGELKVKSTICDEIRDSGVAVFIDCVADEPMWRTHPTPILYGFQSYVSVPVYRADGSFFGTLCAIDPEPHLVNSPGQIAAIEAMALEVAACLDLELQHG
ncbi:MAG: GAF domain-containing protein [Pseudomonadota bacterium]